MLSAAATSAASAAAAATTDAAASIIPPPVLSAEQVAGLSAEQQRQLCTALRDVQLAVQRTQAAELLLLIALERALRCLQTLPAWQHAQRTVIVTCLLDVLQQMVGPTDRSRHGNNWSRVRRLLVTEDDCVFWTEQAERVRFVSWLFVLNSPSVLDALDARFPLRSDRHAFLERTLSDATSAETLKQLVLAETQQSTAGSSNNSTTAASHTVQPATRGEG